MYDNLENFSSTEVLEEICRERGLKKKSLICNADSGESWPFEYCEILHW